jgi:hypothetical protein
MNELLSASRTNRINTNKGREYGFSMTCSNWPDAIASS